MVRVACPDCDQKPMKNEGMGHRVPKTRRRSVLAAITRNVHHAWQRVTTKLSGPDRDHRWLWATATVAVCVIAMNMLPARADNVGAEPGNMVSLPLAVPALDATLPTPMPVTPDWQIETVEPGQTLSQIFDELGLGYDALNQVLGKPEDAQALRSLHPGDELGFLISSGGELQAIRFDRDSKTRVVLKLNGDAVHENVVKRVVQRRTHAGQGSIQSSLFAAGADAGLNEAMVIKLADVFKYDIDFIKDIRKGDHFTVLYDDVWRDGAYLHSGDILAAEFYNRGHRYTAYRFELPDGSFAYYSEDGRPLQKALMRTPVKFTRISSRFTPHRKHPILGYTRAHKGVDYAAPRGTPIHAAGNGKIVVRGRSHGYGNFILIKHNDTYSTAYGHMSGFAKGEHVGSYVRQGDVIGYVGMTGLATGPHLHYEVRIHGHQVNPLTVTMPKPEPLPDALLAKFKGSISHTVAQLRTLDSNRLAWLKSTATSTAGSG